jgi:hypothetical protein
LQPSKSYVVKNNKVKYATQSKERITGLACGSMMGEKMKLVITGKNEKPRYWRSIYNLPINYFWNPSAWMTTDIFLDVFTKWNNEMARQNRKILMFIDNCPSHPQQGLNFSNMKVVFLSPNSTSVTQPMDAGVIKCLKGYYRVSLARKLSSMLESNEIITSNEF